MIGDGEHLNKILQVRVQKECERWEQKGKHRDKGYRWVSGGW